MVPLTGKLAFSTGISPGGMAGREDAASSWVAGHEIETLLGLGKAPDIRPSGTLAINRANRVKPSIGGRQ